MILCTVDRVGVFENRRCVVCLQVDTFASNKSLMGGIVEEGSMDNFTDSDRFTTLRRLVFRGDAVQGTEHDFRSAVQGDACP